MVEEGHVSQVDSSVVERVSVDMVTNLSWWSAGDKSVHPYNFDFAGLPVSMAGVDFRKGFYRSPVYPVQIREPVRVHLTFQTVGQAD